MKPLSKEDLLADAAYERQRDEYRRRIIALKQIRRISIGPKVTLLFENRETVQFQIQEMIRTERIADPAKIQEELDIYNALLPAAGELSATLFIEITDSSDIKRDLDAFQGIDQGQTLSLVAGSHISYAIFEGGHSKEEKISAVHFVRFPLSDELVTELRRPDVTAQMRIEHASYQAEVSVTASLRGAWLGDLSEE
ncbi:fructose-bisphosphate aldolase [Nitrospira sp.]|nr:fructose-bisphosphate aldolase [Nitrospira sp.]